ncbi:hypothetical protein AD932_07840 [Gluconobacter oxydans]|nr:hypothetical protein AD932_07840 [Gluconobacter oxydans]
MRADGLIKLAGILTIIGEKLFPAVKQARDGTQDDLCGSLVGKVAENMRVDACATSQRAFQHLNEGQRTAQRPRKVIQSASEFVGGSFARPISCGTFCFRPWLPLGRPVPMLTICSAQIQSDQKRCIQRLAVLFGCHHRQLNMSDIVRRQIGCLSALMARNKARCAFEGNVDRWRWAFKLIKQC